MVDHGPGPVFPTEIWLQISDELILPSLLYLSLTSRTLYSICERRLRTHNALRTKYHVFNAANREEFGIKAYDTLLFDILKGNIPPSYIVDFGGEAICNTYDAFDPSYDPANDRELIPHPLSNVEEELLRNVIEESKWMFKESTDVYIDRIVTGDEDAVLCVLVPLLKELRHMNPPVDAILLHQVIGRIAAREREVEAEAEGATGDQQLQRRVFPHLVQMTANTADRIVIVGMTLDAIAPFAAIPSLRRIVVLGCEEYEFSGWPDGVPSSRVSEVHFMLSEIEVAAIKDFGRYFEGPCVMKQHFKGEGDASRNKFWKTFEIRLDDTVVGAVEADNTGTRIETIDCNDPESPLPDKELYADTFDWRDLIDSGDRQRAVKMTRYT